jgi:hypothetical protein
VLPERVGCRATVLRSSRRTARNSTEWKKLQEKVFDKLAPKEGEGESREPAKQLLEEGLKKLFGR